MRSRLLHELQAAGETEATMRSALAAHDADQRSAGQTEAGARRWLSKRDTLMIEFYLITGRIIDDLPH